jgi:hypothetical protein
VNVYLVEHYRPGLSVERLRQWVALVRDSAAEMEREGEPVRVLRSTIVPADESLLCVVEAASEQGVREAYARAGIAFERISAAIADDQCGRVAPTSDGRDRGRRQHTERKELT